MASAGEAYRSFAPAVLGYLRACRVEDPEDVLGEVFLHVARDIGKFRGDDAALRRWVFSIAHNRVVDDARRRSRRPRVASDAVPERAAPSPPPTVDPAVMDALAALTPEQREVVVLRFVADLPLDDVARVTKRSRGAVKAMQHRALERLAALLDDDGAGAR